MKKIFLIIICAVFTVSFALAQPMTGKSCKCAGECSCGKPDKMKKCKCMGDCSCGKPKMTGKSDEKDMTAKHTMIMFNIFTPEQKDKAKNIRFEHQKNLVAIEAEIKTIKLDMMNLISAENPNEAAISKKIDELYQTKAKEKKENIKFFLTLKRMLTPEQSQKIKDKMHNRMKDKKEEDMKKMKEHGKGDPH